MTQHTTESPWSVVWEGGKQPCFKILQYCIWANLGRTAFGRQDTYVNGRLVLDRWQGISVATLLDAFHKFTGKVSYGVRRVYG